MFDAGPISSDGGAILLRQVDRRVGLIDSLARVLRDGRDPRYVGHSIRDLLRQRVYQIAMGYQDCNDTLRLRLIKIGVRVQSTARRTWFHLSSSHPWQSLWRRIATRLAAPRPSS